MFLRWVLLAFVTFCGYGFAGSTASSLANERSFVVYYVFAEKNLESPLKEIMVKSLQKLGTVYMDDDKLNAKQREEKYQSKGGVIEITASPVVEENSSETHKALPVIELSLKVQAGVEVLKNKTVLPCTIWEKEKFIGNVSENKEFVEKAIKAMDSILDSFIKDYRIANPIEDNKPQFFLYA